MTNHSDMKLAKSITIGGEQIRVAELPTVLHLHEDLGILTHEAVEGQLVHRSPHPNVRLFETRTAITPGGDYLLMFPEGEHYGPSSKKANNMLAYRSSDKGKTCGSDACVRH